MDPETPTDVLRRSVVSVRKRGCSSKDADPLADVIDTTTPSPAPKRSKRISKNVKKQLLLKDLQANLSKSEEESLLASDSDSSDTCAQDAMANPIPNLSNSEEDSLLASDSSDTCAQEALASLGDALSAKKSKKEQCPKCGKNRTRRTVRRHLKKGCPIKGDRKKSM